MIEEYRNFHENELGFVSESFSGKKSEENFGGDVGITQGHQADETTLAKVKNVIFEHVLNKCSDISAETAESLRAAGFDKYHTIIDDDLHKKLLSKNNRILSKEAIDEISDLGLFEEFKFFNNQFELADEEGVGYPQITYRITRPNTPTDIGDIHADSWFWEYYGFPTKDKPNRTKAWMQISGTPEYSGLLLAPGSHKSGTEYETSIVDGRVRFTSTSEKEHRMAMKRFCPALGTWVFFNHQLLHVGALNTGENCRISLEATILY